MEGLLASVIVIKSYPETMAGALYYVRPETLVQRPNGDPIPAREGGSALLPCVTEVVLVLVDAVHPAVTSRPGIGKCLRERVKEC